MIPVDSPALDRSGITYTAIDLKRKRKRGESTAIQHPLSRWRTINQHRIYSSKLLDALRRVGRNDLPARSRGRAIRVAADRALAATARGGTQWSSAILSGRPIRLKNRRIRSAGGGRWKKPSGASKSCSKMPAVERKVKLLSRLVPGCRKLSLPSLLEEASDYISALEMQVRAMTTLAEVLSGAGGAPAPNRPELDSATLSPS
ncbi:Transcription factor bHLH149 [Platanthera guangdongensis]|uniref:Transcription factor bHLH149 n=1 Tax=Platanthera guangdongensis TaxID=2320717 RepID=A0ABR2MW23_9ASPA